MFKTLPTLTLALLGAMVGASAHADTGITRAQVRAQTLAAMHDGTVIGRLGVPERNVNPSFYRPAMGATSYAGSGTTRSQVQAETLAAIRNGTIIGRYGAPERNVNPSLYPPRPVVAHETRAQVKAELAQAMRTGNMPAPGRITMTLRQEEPQMYG